LQDKKNSARSSNSLCVFLRQSEVRDTFLQRKQKGKVP
jgi:hypothetical protein